VDGVPEIVGGRLAAADTVIEKEASAALSEPSLTPITMPDVVPTCVLEGVPDSLPVEVLKVAQLGLLVIEKVSTCPSGSAAAGWNTYGDPAAALVAGVPEMVGARLAAPDTVIEKGESEAVNEPSLTPMTIFDVVPS
jgi:hypothetical protein